MTVDLHTHTTVSDGVLTPAELVAAAAAAGLHVLAITDHDAMGAIAEARAAAPPGLTIVPGAELTCHVADREAHILAYGIEPGDAVFAEALAGFAEQRRVRARTIVERLNRLGIDLTFAAVEAASGEGTIARPHVAQALVAHGHVGSVDEAFARYLGRGAPAFVRKPTLEPEDAFRMVAAAGGVSVLAHPGTFRHDELIPVLVEAGLQGIEARHTEHSAAHCRHYEAMAAHFGLLPTGGSDFHGTPGHRSRLGRPSVPREWADALVARFETLR